MNQYENFSVSNIIYGTDVHQFSKAYLKNCRFHGHFIFRSKNEPDHNIGSEIRQSWIWIPLLYSFLTNCSCYGIFQARDSLMGLFVQYSMEIFIKLSVKMACHYPQKVDSQFDSAPSVKLLDLYPTC